jgi:hypothetical protein
MRQRRVGVFGVYGAGMALDYELSRVCCDTMHDDCDANKKLGRLLVE